MTDEANAGSVETGNPAGAGVGGAENGSAATQTSVWYSGLQDEGNRKTAETKGWKDADSAIKSYTELEKRLTDVSSKALTPPAPDAPKEQWDAFYGKMGRPEKPDGYELALPKDLPEDLPYNAEFANKFKQVAFDQGYTPKQAQSMHDWYANEMAAAHVAQKAEAEKVSQEAHRQLVTAWGEKDSEGYKANLRFADRFIRNSGDAALLQEMGINGDLGAEFAVKRPLLAQALAKWGKQLFSEDGLHQGTQGSKPRPVAETIFPPENDPFTTQRRA